MKIFHKLTSRFALVSLALIIQIAVLLLFTTKFQGSLFAVNAVMRLFSLVVASIMLNQPSNPAMKLTWMVFILVLPIFGSLLYLITGGKRPAKKLRHAIEASQQNCKSYIADKSSALLDLKSENEELYMQAGYLESEGFPIYRNTDCRYFELGDTAFPMMLNELEKAEKFIFMEYFILAEGEMLGKIISVLERKAREGVDVRLIYDDVGSIFNLPRGFDKKLEAKGIKCHAFNPFVPFISSVMNNRDHRKIMVIDSKVAFSGGVNLADEYINKIERFGHWKDNVFMIKGDGVRGFTLLFLEMWNAFEAKDEALDKFMPPAGYRAVQHGYVQPFGDSPLDDEQTSENVYINAIMSAKRYIYIFTPYLIPDNEMTTVLCLAAKKGVDVRLILPGIPDKKMVYSMTKSYYGRLIKSGVKIYKYSRGFVHSKGFVSDDVIGVLGSINLDFRSLYHHFECGCVLYNSPIVLEIKKDALETIKECEKIEKYQKFDGIIGSTYHAILRLLAPLV